MSLAEIAALGTATCWAIGSLFTVKPIKEIGPIAFVRIRMVMVIAMLSIYLIVTGQITDGLLSMSLRDILILALSGVTGLWFGDMMLFLSMDRLGPRRTSILYATSAPMQVILGVIFLGESMGWVEIFGCILVMIGVYCAIIFGKRSAQVHHWESVKGLLIVGVLFGLAAGFGQAVGALISKPIMDAGASPSAAVLVRSVAALVLFYACLLLPIPNQNLQKPLTFKILGLITLADFFGMTIGTSLLMFAMGQGDLGIVAMLASTTPIILLPLLWITTKERPAIGAWVGATFAVIGVACLSINIS
ncbi:MAG: DMT family transporter [Gammaproteobacteria bacterium]|nr:DMT family transporter [Gammaproteobacteria bacterium]